MKTSTCNLSNETSLASVNKENSKKKIKKKQKLVSCAGDMMCAFLFNPNFQTKLKNFCKCEQYIIIVDLDHTTCSLVIRLPHKWRNNLINKRLQYCTQR